MKRKKKQTSATLVKIYDQLEKIFARKGEKSLWPQQPFQHTFTKGAKVLGVQKSGAVKLKQGDLVIRSSRGKRLWKMFDYK